MNSIQNRFIVLLVMVVSLVLSAFGAYNYHDSQAQKLAQPPSRAAVTAAAIVVFPIPISPITNRSASKSSTAFRPAEIASSNC